MSWPQVVFRLLLCLRDSRVSSRHLQSDTQRIEGHVKMNTEVGVMWLL